MTSLCIVSIPHPDLLSHLPEGVDAVELRFDLHPFSAPFPHNALFTLRSVAHGGKFSGSESEREARLEELLSHSPAFFDLECDLRPTFIEQTIQDYPNTRFIISSHGTELSDLESLFRHNAFAYKVALPVHSTCEALRLLLLKRRYPQLSLICMGEAGSFARVLGAAMGNLLNFVCLNESHKTAPGQLSLAEWREIYRAHCLNSQTELYGLIGDPVGKSRGHLYHNERFARLHRNAVYVKMRVTAEELPEFFPLAREIGFRGLSVTMPLKEKVVPYMDLTDPHAQNIGAVNTISMRSIVSGSNTDGAGALDAIGPVAGCKVVLLGSGGAAKAIGYEATRRGADLQLIHRTSFSEIPPQYDVIINSTPNPMPITAEQISPGAVAMDVTYVPRLTPFLEAAQQRGCKIVSGEEMFLNQALAQSELWMSKQPPFYVGHGILKKLPRGRIVVIADDSIPCPIEGEKIPVPAIKTRAAKEAIEDELIRRGCGRDTLLIGFGGGTICDLVGFVAATYLRGVPHILVPTTLLAMVDASIGGKTAIDTPLGKNLIGAFYPPRAIFADLDLLETLPPKAWLHGLAEVFKLGLVYAPSLFDLPPSELVLRAGQAKMEIVERDPYDRGLRAILNFGHTIGHALENISNYTLPHGEAVAMGSLTESYLSLCMGLLDRALFEKIERLYQRFTYQLPQNYSRAALKQAMQSDKKRVAGVVHFVLIDQIGHALPSQPVSEEKLDEALSWMETYYA